MPVDLSAPADAVGPSSDGGLGLERLSGEATQGVWKHEVLRNGQALLAGRIVGLGARDRAFIVTLVNGYRSGLLREGSVSGEGSGATASPSGHAAEPASDAAALTGACPSRIVAWLEDRIMLAAEDARAHPEGHRSRTFYDAQAIAYENALSFVLASLPAAPKEETR